jgi:hypothetical protein
MFYGVRRVKVLLSFVCYRKVFMSRLKGGVRAEVTAKKLLFFTWEDEP